MMQDQEIAHGDTSNGGAGPTVSGAVAGAVLNLAPEIGRWLFGSGAAGVVAAVQKAVATVSGSLEPEQQVLALADPDKAAALRVILARIAAEQAATAAADGRTAILAGVARGMTPVGSGSPGYGAPLVSMVVLLTFAAVMVVALTRTMPQGAEPVLNVLLGTLGAMATSVVGYWVGSSAGSARKEERLASLAERN